MKRAHISKLFKLLEVVKSYFVYSSLDGIIFKWIIQDKQSGNIRFMKFRDSSYALDPVLEEIEAKGQQGSKVLLEGKLTIQTTLEYRIQKSITFETRVNVSVFGHKSTLSIFYGMFKMV